MTEQRTFIEYRPVCVDHMIDRDDHEVGTTTQIKSAAENQLAEMMREVGAIPYDDGYVEHRTVTQWRRS